MVFKKGESGNPGTQFKAGQSGNPEGYKKGFKNYSTIIKELSEKDIIYTDLQDNKITMSTGEALIISMLGKAIYQQDTQAAKLIIDAAKGNGIYDAEDDTTYIISNEPLSADEWESQYGSDSIQ